MTDPNVPQTLDEALDLLEKCVSEEALADLLHKEPAKPEKILSAWDGDVDPNDDSFIRLQTNIEFGRWVRNRFDLWRGNDSLIDDILSTHEIDHSGCPEGVCDKRHPDCVSAIIIDEFKKRMRKCQKTK